MNKELHNQAWAIAKEYARLTGVILGMDVTDWVGARIENGEIKGTIDVCIFQDYYALTFEEMMEIVDNIGQWRDKYGDNIAVGRQVRQWFEYNVGRDDTLTILERCGEHGIIPRKYINLRSWMLGVRPEMAERETPLGIIIRLETQADVLRSLMNTYPTASLRNALQQLEARIKELTDKYSKELNTEISERSERFVSELEGLTEGEGGKDGF